MAYRQKLQWKLGPWGPFNVSSLIFSLAFPCFWLKLELKFQTQALFSCWCIVRCKSTQEPRPCGIASTLAKANQHQSKRNTLTSAIFLYQNIQGSLVLKNKSDWEKDVRIPAVEQNHQCSFELVIIIILKRTVFKEVCYHFRYKKCVCVMIFTTKVRMYCDFVTKVDFFGFLL